MMHGLEAQTRVQRQGDFIDNFNINETYTQSWWKVINISPCFGQGMNELYMLGIEICASQKLS
jgi:hypothetical protein